MVGSGTSTLASESWIVKCHSGFAHSSNGCSPHTPNDCRLQQCHVTVPYPDTWKQNLGVHQLLSLDRWYVYSWSSENRSYLLNAPGNLPSINHKHAAGTKTRIEDHDTPLNPLSGTLEKTKTWQHVCLQTQMLLPESEA